MATTAQPLYLYFRSNHLGNWRLEGGFNNHLALSGTDRPLLWLYSELARRRGCALIVSALPEASVFPNVMQADNLCAAIEKLRDRAPGIIITANLGHEEMLAAIRGAENSPHRLLIWDQNGPSREVADLEASSPAVIRLVHGSHAQADEYRHRRVFAKISIIYNPIDCSFWTPSSSRRDPTTVVYLGSLTPSKGFHHLAQAWPRIRKSMPGAQLMVCGSGRLYDRTARLGPLGIAEEGYERDQIIPFLGSSVAEAERLGVSFMGLTSPVRTREILNSAALCVVNPNVARWVECCSMASLEAQACGLPIVGGAAGGLYETISDGVTGALVSDPAGLAKIVLRLLSDAELRRRMSAAIPAHLEKFSTDRIARQWESLLDDLNGSVPLPMPGFAGRPIRLRRYIKRSIQICGLQR